VNLGVDVGGTKIAAGLVDLTDGRILARHVVPTLPQRGGPAVLSDVASIVAALVAEAPSDVRIGGIGVGVCELVSPAGVITSGYTVAWRGMPVAASLSAIAPTVVEADIRAHALAEARYGAGRRLGTFIFVTIGTGISSCLVLDGQPHAGARGNALVLATGAFTTTCTTCGALLKPVLEEFASGPALVARYNRQKPASLTRAEEVLAAAADDKLAAAIVQSAGEALGVSIGWLVNVLDPEAVIIGGGLGMAEGMYWQHMVAAARAHIWADASRDVPIVRAALGSDAGVIGAAARAATEDRERP
jgi:glucokinase